MERTSQRNKLLFFILITILLVSSFGAVFANSAIDEQKEESLPDFLLRLSERFSNGNETLLVQIRKRMIEQQKRYQDMFASTNGAILKPPLGSRSYATLDSVDWIWEYHGGEVDNEENMEGYIDSSYAHIHTDEPDAEAWVVGDMSSTVVDGQIYAYGLRGPHSQSGWDNIMFAFISNDTEADYEDWLFSWYSSFPHYMSTPGYAWLGSPEETFSAILVGCYSYYEGDDNCVSIDMVYCPY